MPLTVFESDAAGQLSTLDANPRAAQGVETGAGRKEDVQVERLGTLLDRYEVPRDFALLSIDTEGHDLAVLHGLDLERYRPHIVITETDDKTEAEKIALLQSFGYQHVESVGVNTIWLSKVSSRASQRGEPPTHSL